MVRSNKEIRPAGINDEYGLNFMNIAAEPYRKRTKAKKGPSIPSVSSAELDEGVSIKAYGSGRGID